MNNLINIPSLFPKPSKPSSIIYWYTQTTKNINLFLNMFNKGYFLAHHCFTCLCFLSPFPVPSKLSSIFLDYTKIHNSFPNISFKFLLLSLCYVFLNTGYLSVYHWLPCRIYLCALYSLFSFLAHSFPSVLHPFSFFKLLRALPFFMLHDFSPFIFARSLLSLSSFLPSCLLFFHLLPAARPTTWHFRFRFVRLALTVSWVSKLLWRRPKSHCSCRYAYAPSTLYKFTFILCDAYPSAPFCILLPKL